MTRPCGAGEPLTPMVRFTAGRHEAGPLSVTRLRPERLVAVTIRPGSSTGTTCSLSEIFDSTDHATQPRPRGVVTICGFPPANVPLMLKRTTAACRVSVRFVIVTSSHSLDTSAIRPLLSATGSWLLGEQLLRSPVNVGRENPLPVQRDTTGLKLALSTLASRRIPDDVVVMPRFASDVQVCASARKPDQWPLRSDAKETGAVIAPFFWMARTAVDPVKASWPTWTP